MKARAAQRYFLLTVKPAAVLIQSQWRGYTKRRDLAAYVNNFEDDSPPMRLLLLLLLLCMHERMCVYFCGE